MCWSVLRCSKTIRTALLHHNGNVETAVVRLGGAPADWLDLSTGINPEPHQVPRITDEARAALPRKSDLARLLNAVATYETSLCVATWNSVQGALQVVPWLAKPARAIAMAGRN
ncbi:hypothetical protein [Roseovarius sp. THAF27]|uniref:hypothetical protein n=1 Tax=Roseovarius sp. THAF27 TaxID=2587850 RepID=UPI001267BF5D|nr:hypothetical protein [Roseovarius sp. THAF27]